MSTTTCMNHNDAERTACPVCLVAELTAERDQLRAEVKRLKRAYEYDHKCLCEVQDRCHLWKQRAQKAEAELATEREKVRVLREALENLRDEQNGAPLCTREEEWKQAMDKADAALAATEAKP